MKLSRFRVFPLTSCFPVVLALWLAPLLMALSGCDYKSKSSAEESATTSRSTTSPPKSGPTVDSVMVEAFFKRTPLFSENLKDAQQFYRERGGQLGWIRQGEPVPQARKFLDRIAEADKDGLDPRRYQVVDFQKQFAALRAAKKGDPDKLAELERTTDLGLTGTYFAFAGDFYKGTVDPHVNDAMEWSVKRNKVKLYRALQTILQERESSYPYYEFGSLHPEYDRLRHALSQLRAVEKRGGWGTVPEVKKLSPGDRDSAVVPALRHRLTPGAPAPADPAVYDQPLAGAVRAFQDRHGLNDDGVLGPGTIKALNVPVAERIDQIILNMERWRWIPKKLGDRYVFVNIPAFKLHLVDAGKEVFEMRVIVGKQLKATPVFSDKMKYIVLAPYWNVPASIVAEEIKPAMLRNPGFLESQHMEVVNSKKQEVPASSIDWASVTEENWTKYVLRQRPGNENPLGPMKFIFPNENDVYLHGTPNAWLFNKEQRGFSHGCVRIEDPLKMATYLLRDQPEWTPEKIQQTVAAGEETWVILKQEIPVYLVYFTAWVDEDGTIHFRDDIYGHDQALEKAYFG